VLVVASFVWLNKQIWPKHRPNHELNVAAAVAAAEEEAAAATKSWITQMRLKHQPNHELDAAAAVAAAEEEAAAATKSWIWCAADSRVNTKSPSSQSLASRPIFSSA
jgi:hypothetical protein